MTETDQVRLYKELIGILKGTGGPFLHSLCSYSGKQGLSKLRTSRTRPIGWNAQDLLS